MDDRATSSDDATGFWVWFAALPTVAQRDVLDELHAAIRELDAAILCAAIHEQSLAPQQPTLHSYSSVPPLRSLN